MIFSSWPAWTQNGLIIFALACLIALVIFAAAEIYKEIRDTIDRKFGRSNRDIDKIADIIEVQLSHNEPEVLLTQIIQIVKSNILVRGDHVLPLDILYPVLFKDYNPFARIDERIKKMEDSDATKKV